MFHTFSMLAANSVGLGAGANPTGTSVLTDAIKTTITSGFLDLAATVQDVVLIAVPVIIGIIALTAGINYALGKVRSVISFAS